MLTLHFSEGFYADLKTSLSLSFSVAKRNKGFTLGLIILFLIITTIIVMERYTIPSVRETIDDYSEDYHVPDLWAVTEAMPVSAEDLLPEYPEIIGHEYGMVMDVRCRVREKQVFVLNLTGVEEDGFRKYYFTDETHSQDDIPEVMISSYFAQANNICPGDTVELMTPEGYQDFFVSALVSCPENMFCSRDSTSWCDAADFGFLYLSRSVMDKYYSTAGYSNYWSFRVSDECSDDREEEILESITESFGSHLISAERFSASKIKTQLDDELNQAGKAIQYMPFLAYGLGVFFTCLFIQQVMQDQKKTIGLLRALGYSNRQVLKVFMMYIALTYIIGTALGLGFGAFLTRFSVGIYKNTYSLPYIHYSTSIPLLVLLLAVPLVIGIASCIFRARIITKMDPAEAFGGAAPSEYSELPLWLQKLRLSEMVKIAVVSVYRNKKRFLLSAVSIASSIVISLASLALGISNNAAQPTAFGNADGDGGRFRYDVLIRNSGGDDFLNSVRETEGVSAAEPVTIFMAELCSGSDTLELQINALDQSCTLIVPEDENGNFLLPRDGIVLEEIAAKKLEVQVGDEVTIGNTSLKVNGIAREIVNSIQYISFETAERLGYHSQNEVVVSFEPEADPVVVCSVLSELPGFDYSVVRDHQMQAVKSGCRAKDTAVYISSALAFVLGIIIIYNMVALSVEEKKLDYATLIALGASVKDFFSMAAVENILRYLAAIIPGIPAGCLVAASALNGMSSLKTSYPFMHIGTVCLITGLISLAYLFGGVLFTLWKVKSVEPSAALNARE